ncbi:MAG TPA: PilN domain-containing protein [Gemmatimonadaceae bacterium]|nr:PilN domain-containing protein [Gemmatimonadaceae bacterium]
MIEINLLPGAKRTTRRGVNFAPGAAIASLGANFKDKYLIFAIIGVVLGLGGIAGMYAFQARQQSTLDARESAAAADSARFAAVLTARSHAETTRDSVYQQLAIIKSIDDTRYTWPHLLEAVNLAVPQYTWLVSITQTSAVTTTAGMGGDTSAAGKAKIDSAKKAGGMKQASSASRKAHADSLFNGVASTMSFRVVGQTVDVQALTQFMKNLEASPFIKNVQLTRSDLVTAEGKEVTEFQLEAQTEVPPPHVLQMVPLSLAVR